MQPSLDLNLWNESIRCYGDENLELRQTLKCLRGENTCVIEPTSKPHSWHACDIEKLQSIVLLRTTCKFRSGLLLFVNFHLLKI